MKITIETLRPSSFLDTLARINRRAKRLSLPEITAEAKSERAALVPVFELVGGEKIEVGNESVILATYEISGLEVVKMNGWTLRAISEPLNNSRNIVKALFNAEVPARFFQSGCFCDHCKTDRKRNFVFVVENEKNEWKQVGSTCLKDFCGHEGAESLAAAFEFYGEILIQIRDYIEAEKDGWEGGAKAYDTLRGLSAAVAITRCFGYVSRSKAEEAFMIASGERLKEAFGKAQSWNDLQITPEDEQEAEKVLEMFRTISEAEMEGNGFFRNCHNIAVAGFCGFSGLGIVAAMPAAYQREINRRVRGERDAELAALSEHFGKVGERVELEIKVARVWSFMTDYGMMHKFAGEVGNNAVVCSLPSKVFIKTEDGKEAVEVAVGDVLKLKATIKEHGEYKGVKQTKLARPGPAEILISGKEAA